MLEVDGARVQVDRGDFEECEVDHEESEVDFIEFKESEDR